MKLSTKGQYGLRALLDMALFQSEALSLLIISPNGRAFPKDTWNS
jgi:DNA-binding IscR family transcriptional regulator